MCRDWCAHLPYHPEYIVLFSEGAEAYDYKTFTVYDTDLVLNLMYVSIMHVLY